MTDEDQDLLDRVRLLHSTLTKRTVLLTQSRSNVDILPKALAGGTQLVRICPGAGNLVA